MKKNLFIFCMFGLLICAVGCQKWKDAAVASDQEPVIFPDYKGVTVPCNIAPLNFLVEGAERIQARLVTEGGETFMAVGREGVMNLPAEGWRKMLEEAKGGSLEIQVSLWNEEYPKGISYRPFTVNVAEDEIDPWIVYRLIEPGYEGWRQLGLYQRCLSSFEETAIVTNKDATNTCVNCHHFPAYSSGSMMFHARGKNGGTILYHEGKLDKIDFRNIGLKKNTTYPAWHPGGRFIAFSSNTTHQVFYGEGKQQIEVFDTASDLVLYDTQTGEALTDQRFINEQNLETFPAWSPDGRYLYFASYKAKDLPVKFSNDMHYDILRVAFDVESRTFSDQVDTVYNTRVCGGSASYPRISADGRYLLYTWSDYGTFPIWHREADLRMIDLETMASVDVTVWNDPSEAESYHSWSSDGRWAMYGSRRLDGRYTRLYIAYFDEDGNPHKPFLLPQEDPRYNIWRLKSFNVPEFIDGKVEVPEETEKLFYPVD